MATWGNLPHLAASGGRWGGIGAALRVCWGLARSWRRGGPGLQGTRTCEGLTVAPCPAQVLAAEENVDFRIHVENQTRARDDVSRKQLRLYQLYSRTSGKHIQVLGRRISARGEDGDKYGRCQPPPAPACTPAPPQRPRGQIPALPGLGCVILPLTRSLAGLSVLVCEMGMRPREPRWED